ncbi:MAG: DUF167 domain-containing protein [Solirubrobacterales bacterium]
MAAAALDLRESEGGVTLKVRVQPRASRDALGGEREGALVVRLTAPPVEGAANEALVRFLGKALDVAPSAVRIVGGATGRNKLVTVAGIDGATVRARLGGGPPRS